MEKTPQTTYGNIWVTIERWERSYSTLKAKRDIGYPVDELRTSTQRKKKSPAGYMYPV